MHADEYLKDIKEDKKNTQRQLTLLLNLEKSHSLDFQEIREKIMPADYCSENPDSDRKKLKRDIEILRSAGLNIRYNSAQAKYTLVNLPDHKIRFTTDELRQLSLSIGNADTSDPATLTSLARKIFAYDMKYFPEIRPAGIKTEEKKVNRILGSIIEAVKNRTPLRIKYARNLPDSSEKREIDPYKIVKKSSEDFYLIAWDRAKREYRRFMIPKITETVSLPDDFLGAAKLTEEAESLHPLNLSIHDAEEIELAVARPQMWKMENFLSGHPYRKNGDIFSFRSANTEALFSFMARNPDMVTKCPVPLGKKFAEYIKEITAAYE